MSQVQSFTFNDFQENTYLIYDETNEGIIIDPGCHTKYEKALLKSKIAELGITLKRLILTHAHIDHVFGNAFIYEEYHLKPELHRDELEMLQMQPMVARQYGLSLIEGPTPDLFLKEGEQLTFGNTTFEMLLTPGHSPASLSFYNQEEGYLIGGDVLFKGSIGRTDLPGGNMDTLLHSINTQLMSLPPDTVVYSGHGPATTIGQERLHNPFMQQLQ